MASRCMRYGMFCAVVTLALSLSVPILAQHHPIPDFAPPHRPLVKLIGFLNPDVPETTVHPVLTLAFPGDEKRHTFLLADMRIMAGPLRTPGSILSEVQPYTTNFYIRASHDVIAQLRSATPAEQVSILAEYSRAGRILMVKSIEKSEDPHLH